MKYPLAWCVAVVVGEATAQEPALPLAPFQGVYVAPTAEDGAVWVRGDRYKVGLADDVLFQPLLGPSSPRDWPLRLRFQGSSVGSEAVADAAPAPWQVMGTAAERRCGDAVERWDFAPGQAQQSFRFEQPTGAGALVCSLAVTTDLRAEPDGPGVTFTAPDGRGGVHYSDAVVVDAAGERLHLPVDWVAGQLRIVVPAAFVATATWPIVVDPWLNTIVVDSSVSDLQGARTAYDETNDVWLVVAEEVLSATDSDIVTWSYAAGPSTPVLLDTSYAAITTNQTVNPDVGNMAEHQLFVLAWFDRTNVGTGSGQLLYTRRLASASSSSGSLTALTNLGTAPDHRAHVGCSQTGRLFFVAVLRYVPNSVASVQARLADVGGQFYSSHTFSLPVTAIVPTLDITTRQGAADPWVLVWHECTPGCASTVIKALALSAPQNAGVFSSQIPIVVATGSADFVPRIAGSGGRWLVVWQRNTFRGGASLLGQPLSAPGGTLGLLGGMVDLHAGEPNSVPVLRRVAPTISHDGVRYVVTYDEEGANGTEPHAMTVVVDAAGTVAWHDGHVSLGLGAGTGHGALDIAASTGAHLGRHFVVLQRPATNGDLLAATIDAYVPGTLSSVVDIGCGLPAEPTIGLSGTPALGRTFTVSLGNVVGAPFLLIGLPAVAPLPGCGTCQQGVVLASAVTMFGTASTITVPTSPSFLHLPIGFQGLSMLQAGGCPATVFGIDFALSDLLQVEIL